MNYLTKEELEALIKEGYDFVEIPVFNPEIDFEENFNTGPKYLVLPIDNNEFGYYQNRKLIAPGTKIISGTIDFEAFIYSEQLSIIVDYASMFGVRLNRFMLYNPNYFNCDERVFFESLVMKYRYFKFKPFYLSYKTIFNELGIKKDRAVSIRRKFENIGILKSEIVTSSINGKPSQITYYELNLDLILNLLLKIYKDEDDIYDCKNDVEKYLKGMNA